MRGAAVCAAAPLGGARKQRRHPTTLWPGGAAFGVRACSGAPAAFAICARLAIALRGVPGATWGLGSGFCGYQFGGMSSCRDQGLGR